MIRRIALLAAISSALAFNASAQDLPDSTRTAIEGTVSQINQNAKIGWINPGPIAGLNEVGVDGVVLYISDDGKYLFHGTVLDVDNRRNLTELAGAKVRRDLLVSIDDSDKIIFSPAGTPKHKVIVFTDISCGYCSAVHENIQGYLDLGIQIEYVAFPRGGPQSPVLSQMEQIWCAGDRKTAYASAVSGKAPTGIPNCDNPVRSQYELGDRVGVDGTPAIYTYDGVRHGGFLPPDKLFQALESKRAPGTPDADDDDVAQGKSEQKARVAARQG